MRVVIERTGGFAGLEETVAVYDTDDLPGGEAAKVEAAVETIGAAAARREAGELGADLVTYRITVGEGSPRVYTVPSEPPPELVAPLSALLRPSA